MGEWLLRALIAGILFVGAVLFHTQAPLATHPCPPPNRDAYSQKHDPQTQEYCASLDVLITLSLKDFLAAIGGFIDVYKDYINALAALVSAISTLIIAFFTRTLWISTHLLYRSGEKQIEAVRESVEVAKRALLISERPWISVEVAISRGIVYTSDFCLFDLECKLENIGKTIAHDVRIMSRPYTLESGLTGNAIQREFLTEDQADVFDKYWMGFPLLPNEQRTTVRRQTIPRGDVEKNFTGQNAATKIFNLEVAGVITYKFDTSNKTHYTGFVLTIIQKSRRPGIAFTDGNLVADEMLLLRREDNWLVQAT